MGLGALAIPGIGPVVAGGALATAFGLAGGTAVAGAGIGAAAGGIVGALVGMGIPEEEARYFEAGFREGGVLVTVNGRDRAPEALAVLERHGADTGAGLRARAPVARPGNRREPRDVATARSHGDGRGASSTRSSGAPGGTAGGGGWSRGGPGAAAPGGRGAARPARRPGRGHRRAPRHRRGGGRAP